MRANLHICNIYYVPTLIFQHKIRTFLCEYNNLEEINQTVKKTGKGQLQFKYFEVRNVKKKSSTMFATKKVLIFFFLCWLVNSFDLLMTCFRNNKNTKRTKASNKIPFAPVFHFTIHVSKQQNTLLPVFRLVFTKSFSCFPLLFPLIMFLYIRILFLSQRSWCFLYSLSLLYLPSWETSFYFYLTDGTFSIIYIHQHYIR